MAAGQVNRIVHHLRWIAQAHDNHAGSDGQLLDGFVARQDEAAFEELLRRHGPMVLGVCRRVLGNADDADDAFQATFMVLVRKARSVVPRELVGNWLYGVAFRVALDAQARASRRRAREKQVVDMPHPTSSPPPDPDLRPVLDLELSRLPEKVRVPIVLCDLEGRSRKDVARQLGIPEGTLSSRLASGRKMLAARLTRHGLPFSAAALGVALSASSAQAIVPATLAVSTVKAAAAGAPAHAVALGLLSARAAALTEGVMKAMLIGKLKTLAAVIVTLGLCTTGAGVMTLTADEPRPGLDVVQVQKPGLPTTEAEQPAGQAEVDFLFFDPKTGKIIDGPNRLRKGIVIELEGLQFQELPNADRKPYNPPLPDAPRVPMAGEKAKVLRRVEAGSASPAFQLHFDGKPNLQLSQNHRFTVPGDDDVIIVIRVPKKGNPGADAEFLRRVCKQLAHRAATGLEMDYFLKDPDPRKHRAIVEKLMQGDAPAVSGRPRLIVGKAAEPTDPASQAEKYVKEKLGKKELTTDERQLVRQVLEFMQKSQPKTAPAGNGALRFRIEGAPKLQVK